MGSDKPGRRQLASSDHAVAHAGLPGVWAQSRSAPSCKCRLSCHQWRAALPGTDADDRRFLAERARGRDLRLAPAAGGVGRVDCGAEGCAEWIFLSADATDIREVRAGTRKYSVFSIQYSVFS